MSKSLRRRLLFWTIVVLVVALPFTGLVRLDSVFVYHPSRYPEGDWRAGDHGFEEAWFQSADGTRLHGWFAEVKSPRAVVLHAHGNAGNVTHRAELLELFRARFRCSFFVFDYRGFGRSEGAPEEAGILADARAARAWLAQRAGVAETDIVLHGTSLGGGVAVDLAARDGARGLILENTFTSIPDVARRRTPFLPVWRLLSSRLDSLAKIGSYRGPLLQMHGDADRAIPFDLGQRLFAAANEPKTFVRVPGADHNDFADEVYLKEVNRFLNGL